MRQWTIFWCVFWLCLASAWAELPADPLEVGDNLARLGDYEGAQAAYLAAPVEQLSPRQRRRLLWARLALAQARNNTLEVKRLSGQLEELLSAEQDLEIAVRLQLVRGAVAYRTQDLAGAREAFSRARPLADTLNRQGNPIGSLALYECMSYDYLQALGSKGRPLGQDYGQACQAAHQVVRPSAQPLWALDIYRSLSWTRLWVWQSWEYSFLAYRKQDLPLAGEWAQISYVIGSQAAEKYWKAYEVSQDAELLTATLHAYLELTEGFAEAPSTPQILKLLAPVFEKFSATPTGERFLLQGRYHRSWARYQFFALKDAAAALKEYQLAADFFGKGSYPIDQMDILAETAYVYLLNQAPKNWETTVESNLQQLLRLSQDYSYPLGRYYGLGLYGVLQARAGRPKEGEAMLRGCFEQMQQWNRHAAATPQARNQALERPEVKLFGDTLIEILLQQGRSQEALETTQNLTAQAESAGLDLSRIVPKDAQTAQDLQSLLKTRGQAGQLQSQLQSAQVGGDLQGAAQIQEQLANNRADFEKTVNRLRQRDPEFERVLSVRPSSFSKLQAQLSPEVVVVEYYPSQDKLILFAVTSKHLRIFSAPIGRDQLNASIRTMRRKVAAREPLDDNRLYSSLIEPLEPLLQDHKVLAVIPSGPLYYLPFSALRKNNGGYLAERVSVCLLTATEFPEVGRFASHGIPKSLLALANPDGTLPGASREVASLARLFSRSTSYVGDKATKDKINGNSDILHLATHGTLNGQDVNESYLQMAGKDGRLTTGEIYSLELGKVSLVTLSACQTALGEFNPGSEVASLSQAFSVAGSKTMLASLWQVEDESTASLMLAFYRHLLTGKSKAESLRLAQLDLLKQPRWSHPFFWAPFELIGDWH